MDTIDSAGTDDVWLPSSCALCYGTCSIKAHRVDGVVVKIEGNPDSVVGKGKLCGKGVSGLMTRYDPNRVRVPLRRTNPEKGIDVDPGWEEISWEEALTEVADNLRRVRADDPRKLVIQRTTTLSSTRTPVQALAAGFGTPNVSTAGGGLHCGNGAHLISGVMHASWSVVPDFERCNYSIFFGASKGHSAGHASCSNMGKAADARVRGMKMVVVDPMCNFAAAKATEWVPIRVGGDGALALGLCSVLVNELGAIDAPYLKAKTNGAYLIGSDRRYVRDPANDLPLVWDTKQNAARPFSEVASDDMALDGEYQAAGVACRPAFAVLAEHLKDYTPERCEELCAVPAVNIRRIATEFAEEARIGSTIVIDGVTVPYRPVAAIAFRGAQGHINSVYNFLAIDLLNQLVGSADMAGGCLGFNPACDGFPETGRLKYRPHPDRDGLMETGMWMAHRDPYPLDEPQMPQQAGLQDLFVMGMTSPLLASTDQEMMWNKFDLPYRPEMMVNFGTNMMMSIGNRDTVEATLKTYKFIVSFDLFLTETSEFADIVLPDCDYLQSKDSRSNYPFIFSHPGGMGDWCWPIRQPIVPPDGEQRPFGEVLLDLAERAGFLDDLHAGFNMSLDLQQPYRLEAGHKYTYDEICDADVKDKFGPEHDFEWFKKNGVIKWPKKPQEVYWRAFTDVRVPIYWEWMLPAYEKIAAIADPRGMKTPKHHYQPLPSWIPCHSHECQTPEFDFYAFYYRDIIHTNSFTMENAWLDEAARLDPFSYTVAMHADIGHAKGIEDGDIVWIETETQRRVKGKVHLTQAIHPEGLGIGACAGHWGKGMPVARNKGVFFNQLLEVDLDHSNPVNLNLDLCAKVRVSKVEAVA